jgi:hypothetical protein
MSCYHAMADHSMLLGIEQVTPPGNEPSHSKLADLNMLVFTGGCERTEAEYRALFAAAGFTLRRIIHTQSLFSVIEGVRTSRKAWDTFVVDTNMVVESMSEGYLSPRCETRGRARGTHAGQAMRPTTRLATVSCHRTTACTCHRGGRFFCRMRHTVSCSPVQVKRSVGRLLDN